MNWASTKKYFIKPSNISIALSHALNRMCDRIYLTHSAIIGPMLGRRLRRWPNIYPTMDKCLVLLGRYIHRWWVIHQAVWPSSCVTFVSSQFEYLSLSDSCTLQGVNISLETRYHCHKSKMQNRVLFSMETCVHLRRGRRGEWDFNWFVEKVI